MNNKRIALNTIYIYIGVSLCTILSLLTVPILLKNLGVNDYGLYNLVAGIIVMLSFFKNSMTVTVQRFMNVAYGENDIDKVNKIFTISLLLYLTAAFIIGLVIELLGPFITNGYLNIDEGRVQAATTLFQVLVISTIITTIGVPFDALFNVYEDMWLFAFFNTLDHLLRLLFAIFLGYINSFDRLVLYAWCLIIISLIVFFIKIIVCKKKYKQIKGVSVKLADLSIIRDILSFIGWNLYSTIAKIFSTQGYAVVLNLFMGTAINAAYGIANQVNGALQQFTSSLEKAFNPQIMKSEGMKDEKRLIQLSLYSTKYCSFIYTFIAIPLLASLSYILDFWLVSPPDYTISFTKIVIIASMISMLTIGLAPMLYARGKISNYLFWLGTSYIVIVFIAFGFLKLGTSVIYAVSIFIPLEIILLVLRLHYCRKYVGLSLHDYFMNVIVSYCKTSIPTFLLVYFMPCNNIYNFITVLFISIISFLLLLYLFGLTQNERILIKNATSTYKDKFLKQKNNKSIQK